MRSKDHALKDPAQVDESAERSIVGEQTQSAPDLLSVLWIK